MDTEELRRLLTLVEDWDTRGDLHEWRANAKDVDAVNFNRQDAYAYAARLHARELRAAIAAMVARTHDPLSRRCTRCGYEEVQGHASNCIHYSYWQLGNDIAKAEGR